MVTFDAGTLRVRLSAAAQVEALVDSATGKDYLATGQPASLLSIRLGDKELTPTSLVRDEARKQIKLMYGDSGITATVNVGVKPTHLTFELDSVEGGKPTEIKWGPLPTTIGMRIGEFVGVVRDEKYAIGLQTMNVQTVGRCGRTSYGSQLHAVAIEREGGIKGSKIAIFGCRDEKALATIGEIELAEGLPHPMLDGVWGKVSPTARLPYFLATLSEANLNEVLDVARKAGFRYVYDTNPFETWGHLKLDSKRFPDGDESMRRCVEKAGKLGIRLGCHTLCDFITPNDPYITPIPDRRLARTGSSTLARAVDGRVTEIAVADAAPFRDRGVMGTVIIGEELVRYTGVSDNAPAKLLDCERGAWGTKAWPHEAGADIGKLADYSYRIFYPGVENGMLDELAGRLVELFNKTGMRIISFDGLGGPWSCGYGGYSSQHFVKQVYDGWKVEVINDAAAPLQYLWHINTRFNWGEITQSVKMDIDHYRLMRNQQYEDNLLPAAMGWWQFGLAAPCREATRLEEIEYLLAKAAGYNACHALHTAPSDFRRHGYGDACLRMVKMWGDAQHLDAFTEAQRAKLRERGRDFHLEPIGEKRWTLTEVKYSPFFWMCPGTGRAQPGEPASDVVNSAIGPAGRLALKPAMPGLPIAAIHHLGLMSAGEDHSGHPCPVKNPFARQPLRFELRVLGSFDYHNAGNVDLAPTEGAEFRPDPCALDDAPRITMSGGKIQGRNSADGPAVRPADRQIPWMRGYEITAVYDGQNRRSRDTRLAATFANPLDLSRHRGLGLWVRGDGKGELLTVELTNRFALREYCAVRQYYIPINFTGERYFEFPSGEVCFWRYYDYEWGQGWDKGKGLADWNQTLKGFDYTKVCRIAIGFNAIPRGERVSCTVAGIKALKELGASLCGLSLEREGKKVSFEGDLRPDCYLIYDGGEKAEVRDANFRLLGEAKVLGDRIDLDPMFFAHRPAGQPALRQAGMPAYAQKTPGESRFRVSYVGAGGPAPWSRVEFKCYGPSEEIAAK